MIDIEKKTKRLELVSWFTFFILGLVLMSLMLWSTVLDVVYKYRRSNDVDNDVIYSSSLNTSDVVDRGYSFTSSTIPCLMSYVKSNTLNDVLPGTTDALCKTVYSNVVFVFDTYAEHLIDARINCLLPSTSSGSWFNTDFHVYYDADAISKSYTDNRKFTKISHIDTTSNDYYVLTTCKFIGDFNYNVVKISTDYHVFFNLFNWRSTRLFFYDNNGNSLEFQFAISDRSSSVYTNLFTLSKIDNIISGLSYSYMLSPRTYYITNDFSDNEFYSAGLKDGLDKGLADNQQSIYDDAFSKGRYVGNQEGYEKGLEDGGQYTFMSLMGAVVDAPINYLISLLNFEVLGFNMLNLMTGLFTLAIVFVVVRLVFFRR